MIDTFYKKINVFFNFFSFLNKMGYQHQRINTFVMKQLNTVSCFKFEGFIVVI